MPVAGMLNKLLAEFTKSRANRSTDNALIEDKNGAVVRKHVGIDLSPPSMPATPMRSSPRVHPYLNFHQPCGFAVLVKSAKGRLRRRYPAEGCITPFELRTWASRHSETEAARIMQNDFRDPQSRSTLRVIRPFLGTAQASPLLDGEGGSKRRPLPSCHPWLQRNHPSGEEPLNFVSHSLQARPALELNSRFRLISGLENAISLAVVLALKRSGGTKNRAVHFCVHGLARPQDDS